MPEGPAADDGGRGPKRLIADPNLRDRVEIAHHHGIPTSKLNAWASDDLANELDLRQLGQESCGHCGVHPSQQHDLVPDWKHCRVCELKEEAQQAGPPTEDKGWHLVLQQKKTH